MFGVGWGCHHGQRWLGQHENAVIQAEPGCLSGCRRAQPAHAHRPTVLQAPFDCLAGGSGAAVECRPQGRVLQAVPGGKEGDLVIPRLRGGDEQGIEVAIEIEASSIEQPASIGQQHEQLIDGRLVARPQGRGAQAIQAKQGRKA